MRGECLSDNRRHAEREGCGMNRRRNFTLIELLVVISIFAILAALLLPALNSAAGKGRQISCLNTISQITKGFFLYADDFDQVVLTNDAANKPWTRIMRDSKYFGESLWLCPEMSTRHASEGKRPYNTLGIYRCDLTSGNPPLYNTKKEEWGEFRLPKVGSDLAYSIKRMNTPGKIFLAGDTRRDSAAASGPGCGMYVFEPRTYLENGAFGLNHLGSGNLSFFDGHAAVYRRSALQYQGFTRAIWNGSKINL